MKDTHGIIQREILKDAHIDIAEAKECEELALSLNKGKKMLALIDANNFHTITPEATEYLKEAHLTNRIATAIVSKSISEKIMASYIELSIEKVTLKIFATKDEAIKWLLKTRIN